MKGVKAKMFVTLDFMRFALIICVAGQFVTGTPVYSKPPFVVYVRKAIANIKILPTTYPKSAPAADEISVTACPDEYEPATFVLYAHQNIKGLKVMVADLKSEGNIIPSSSVQVYVVKCWYQAGKGVRRTNQRIFTPELLLKDDDLIRVDMENKENYLRTRIENGDEVYVHISGKNSEHLKDIQPKDAETLQPVNIPAKTAKQFWFTIHVPEDAIAGDYKGKIRLVANEFSPEELTLRLRVLPFKLENPLLRYAIYYRGKLTKDGKGSISSEWKSPKQYEAEMRDLKAHGVEYPTVYQNYNKDLLREVFKIRERAGLPKGPLYTLGITTGHPTDPERLEARKKGVRRWVSIAKEYGYDEVYVYGIDEARGEKLTSQRPAWNAVHEAGGKVFVACYKGAFEAMGDLLDLAVLARRPDSKEAKKYHNVGHQIFCYAFPQVANEEPETYRRNFGLVLWKAGYDGAMDYAYQHAPHHNIWNDFDHPRYRDFVFAYPTVDGVIDTIQWEGFREGVDDVRYLTTLLKAIEKAKADAKKRSLAEHFERWVQHLDTTGNLYELRSKIVKSILDLM